MNKKEKKKTNMFIFTLIMLVVFVVISQGIIWGFGSEMLLDLIYNYPKRNLVISEAVLAVLVLIVMLLFKNSYVFTQKRESIKVGLFYGMFYILVSGLFLFINGIVAGGFNSGLTIINLLLGCILIGITEEFLCRGWLLNEFLERYSETKKEVWYSIIMSGVIFGLMHISNIFYTGQSIPDTITQVISASSTGIIFGLIYYKTKNIWSVIILHALWDFSLLLSEIAPLTSEVEIVSRFSIIGIVFSVLLFFIELLNIIPYISDIDSKPKKKSIIILSIISGFLFIIFSMLTVFVSNTFGNEYKYTNISLKHYAMITDNYDEYHINYSVSRKENYVSETNELSEKDVVNNYSFKLSTNNFDNLLLTNTQTNDYIEIECQNLADYIILEEENQYILAYVDYTNSSNTFLNYVYIDKDDLSNDKEYLTKVKNGIKKYLLPDIAELLIIKDRESNKTYLAAFNIDYGYFLLIKEDEIAILNSDK